MLTKYFRRKFLLSYTGLSNNLLIVTIPKAFFKLRLSCAEIEVYHNVCHHMFSEIYCTDAVYHNVRHHMFSEIYCTDAVYHNVCHHMFSEIYCTDAVCSILDLHRKFLFLNFEIYYLRALRLLNSSMSLSSSLET
jgi:hypothetical protein